MKGATNIEYKYSELRSNNLAIPYDTKKDYLIELHNRCHKEYGFLYSIGIEADKEDLISRTIAKYEPSIVDEAYNRFFGGRTKIIPFDPNQFEISAFVYAVQMKHNIFINRDLNKVHVNDLFDIAYRYDDFLIDDSIPYINDGLRFSKYGNIMILGIRYYIHSIMGECYTPVAIEDTIEEDIILKSFMDHLRINNDRRVFMLSEDDNPYSQFFHKPMRTFKEVSLITCPNT